MVDGQAVESGGGDGTTVAGYHDDAVLVAIDGGEGGQKRGIQLDVGCWVGHTDLGRRNFCGKAKPFECCFHTCVNVVPMLCQYFQHPLNDVSLLCQHCVNFVSTLCQYFLSMYCWSIEFLIS